VSERLSPARKKARLLAAYLRGRPVWCSWQLTPRCGPQCAFCEHRAEGAVVEADLPTLERIGQELSRVGSLVVSLSGGEPFLRPELPEIVGMLSRWHFPLLSTWGFRVTAERAKAVWQAGLEAATVILDHPDPAETDRLTGIPGAHARALAALQDLSASRVKAGQQVNVKARLADGQVDHLPELLSLASAHGATVTVEPAFPVAAGVDEPGLNRRLLDLRRQYPNLRTDPVTLGRFDEARAAGVGGCLAGRAFLNVDHLGRVSKCVEFQEPEDRVGDLASEGAEVVLARLREVHRANRCRSCWAASRAEIERLHTVRGFFGAIPDLVRA
jgi:MoaA/NifB/PqqE/SkfB family radical SAM enzyme